MHDSLWAPWRMTYLRELEQRRREIGDEEPVLADFIAHAWANPDLDEQSLVVHRNQAGLVMLNRFPYANGHLLVALGVAKPRLLDHTPDERAAFWGLVEIATDLVEILERCQKKKFRLILQKYIERRAQGWKRRPPLRRARTARRPGVSGGPRLASVGKC